MAAPGNIPAGEYVPTADQRVVLVGATWEHYEVELMMRGDKPVPRLAYFEGALELMSPSRDHQRITSYLGRLIEVFAELHDIELSPYRSWTLKSERTAGSEPDECYIVGADQGNDRPDLVIEVIWTSGGIDKLEIYKRLGIDEVWFWIEGRLDVYSLRSGTYEQVSSSRWLPGLDLALMCTFLDRRSVHLARRDFREALRAAGSNAGGT
jgi:Uma2 family endonuclease